MRLNKIWTLVVILLSFGIWLFLSMEYEKNSISDSSHCASIELDFPLLSSYNFDLEKELPERATRLIAIDDNCYKISWSELGLDYLPRQFFEYGNDCVCVLDLDKNYFEGLPINLDRFSNLKKLNLKHNIIEKIEIPNGLGRIEELDLKSNLLTEFPLELLFLPNLKELNISNNLIKHFDNDVDFEGFGNGRSLEVIDLSNNGLRNFPEGLGRLPKLKKLRLANNELQDTIEIRGFFDLEELVIDKQNVSAVFFDWDIGSELEKISLSRNSIQTFEFNGVLDSLSELNLRDNYLTKFPDLTGMPNIIEIDLADNKIQDLPAGLLDLSNLDRLYIQGNPLNKEAYEILDKLKEKGIAVDTYTDIRF